MPAPQHDQDEPPKGAASDTEPLGGLQLGGLQTKRVNFNLPESAVAEAMAAARKKGWNLTQFFLFALALAVRVIDETAAGGQVLLKSSNGEVRELLIPKW